LLRLLERMISPLIKTTITSRVARNVHLHQITKDVDVADTEAEEVATLKHQAPSYAQCVIKRMHYIGAITRSRTLPLKGLYQDSIYKPKRLKE
jgi:hypothetical protein